MCKKVIGEKKIAIALGAKKVIGDNFTAIILKTSVRGVSSRDTITQ